MSLWRGCSFTTHDPASPCPWVSVVTRLVEEVKLRASELQLQNEDVYMATSFQEFIQMCVRKLRGEDGEEELVVDYVSTVTFICLLEKIGLQSC